MVTKLENKIEQKKKKMKMKRRKKMKPTRLVQIKKEVAVAVNAQQ